MEFSQYFLEHCSAPKLKSALITQYDFIDARDSFNFAE